MAVVLGCLLREFFAEAYNVVLCDLSLCEQDGFHRDDGRRGLARAGFLSLTASLRFLRWSTERGCH